MVVVLSVFETTITGPVAHVPLGLRFETRVRRLKIPSEPEDFFSDNRLIPTVMNIMGQMGRLGTTDVN